MQLTRTLPQRLMSLCLVAVIVPVAGAQSLQRVGALPTGEYVPIAQISADGSTLIANSATDAYRWRAGTWELLPRQSGATFARAFDLSADGTHVVGETFVPGDPFAVSRASLFDLHGWAQLPSTWTSGETRALHVAGNASTILVDRILAGIGASTRAEYVRTASGTYVEQTSTFVASSVMTGVPLGGADENSYSGLSRSGDTAIGNLGNLADNAAQRFGASSASTFSRPSNVVPAAFFDDQSRANVISGDGAVIYGTYAWSGASAPSFAGNISYRWTAATGIVTIPVFTNALSGETSFDGDILVSGSSIYIHSLNLTSSISLYLFNQGVEMLNWSQLQVTDVSDDGRTFVGTGRYEHAPGLFRDEPWIVTVPAPGSAAVACASLLALRRRRR